jgi:hypothetical protein
MVISTREFLLNPSKATCMTNLSIVHPVCQVEGRCYV